MIFLCRMLAVGTLWLFWGGATAEPGADLIAAMRTVHPRLILLDERLPALREAVAKDPVVAAWYAQISESATALLTAPEVVYSFDARRNMLEASRQAVDRIYRLGFVYRMDGEKRFAQRAIAEMLHAAQLDSWHPQHFLDTAELSHAMGIGYDWLYSELTPDQRAVIREAVCRKGLEEGLHFLRSGVPVTVRYWNFNWAVCKHNWNQVCNGGLAVAALAIAEDAPQLAGEVVAASMSSIRRAMAEFAPDGGWPEGPGYWEYATSYNVYFLAALETALGPAVIEPYLRVPGFAKTGEFRIQMVGPINKSFNFADSRDSVDRSAQLFWMARRFHRPAYAWHAAQNAAPSPLDIIWYDPEQKTPKEMGMPLDAYFRHVEVAFFRGALDDPNATYVGFKGGSVSFNHAHADLGTFVLDADGARWALDLGRDSYSLPGYFEVGRVAYYRLKTEGHNTLLFNGQNQRLDGKAPIVAFHSTPDRAFAVADLSQAYNLRPGAVRRGVMLLNRRAVLLQDDLDLEQQAEVVWQVHTQTEIAIEGPTATLRQGDKTLTVTTMEPAGATFEVLSANPPPPQAQQPDVHKLAIRLKAPVGKMRIAVTFSPGEKALTPELKPLTAWIAESEMTGGS